MRKLSILVLAMMLAVACQLTSTKSEGVQVEGNVFSNAYDGYLTLRSEPSANSEALEVLHNGPKGATMVQYHPKWSIVSFNGVQGYVKTEYLQTSPTKPAYAKDHVVIGAWCLDNEDFPHSHDLLIFANGTYIVYNYHCFEGSFTSVGLWRLEEHDIVLTECYDLFADAHWCGGRHLKSNCEIRYRVDMSNYTLTEVADREEPMVLITESEFVRRHHGKFSPFWPSESFKAAKETARGYLKGILQ